MEACSRFPNQAHSSGLTVGYLARCPTCEPCPGRVPNITAGAFLFDGSGMGLARITRPIHLPVTYMEQDQSFASCPSGEHPVSVLWSCPWPENHGDGTVAPLPTSILSPLRSGALAKVEPLRLAASSRSGVEAFHPPAVRHPIEIAGCDSIWLAINAWPLRCPECRVRSQ